MLPIFIPTRSCRSSQLKLISDLDPRYIVYGVKSLSAVPLVDFASAQTAVNSVLARFKSAAQTRTLALDASDLLDPAEGTLQEAARTRVKFSDTNDVKLVTPRATEFSDTSPPTSGVSSGSSTPVSDSDVVAPLAKVLASRLSFWSRGSRTTLGSTPHDDDEEPLAQKVRDKLPLEGNNDEDEPGEVVKEILDSAASAPSSEGERQRELDGKVLKSIIREFTKGQMYFAYDFGEFQSVVNGLDGVIYLYVFKI